MRLYILKIYAKTFLLFTIALCFFSHDSFATRLVDLSTSFSVVKSTACVTSSDIEKYGIASYENGFQANFHSEQQYVDLLNKVYNCDAQFTAGYFLYGKWETDDAGKQKTIADSIDRNWEKTWKLKNGLRYFGSFEEAVESTVYKKSVEKYGADTMFIQRIDFENQAEDGLFDRLHEQVD